MIDTVELCKFDFEHTIIITNDFYISAQNSQVYQITSQYYESVVDGVSSVVTFVNINGASQLISFIQFNQLFLFFSIWKFLLVEFTTSSIP